EIEGEMGDQLPGLQARLMSQALRKLTGNIKRSNCTVVFINQLRMKIGQMMPGQSPETTTGGNALKFYASVRLDIRRIGAVKKGDEIIGNQTKVKIAKNKVAPPFRVVTFDILYGENISREGEIIEHGVTHKIVEKSGAWYSYNGNKIGQGLENSRQFLKDNVELTDEIVRRIREKIGGAQLPIEPGNPLEDDEALAE
ncbi:MAG TPA: DNA recombination/repair protein RecA, partial [Chitinolyticbacter sp.]|nr:DNA recombination/repair protein RecA [Chitinolyticbacter sp.]